MSVLDELTYDEKAVIYVLGLADDLVDRGYIEGQVPLTDEGTDVRRQLVESGFRLSPEEIRYYTRMIFRGIYESPELDREE